MLDPSGNEAVLHCQERILLPYTQDIFTFVRVAVRPVPSDTLTKNQEALCMLRRFDLNTSIRITTDSSIRARIRAVPLRLVVLSLFVAFLVSNMAYAQAPAGPNRPAGVPDGYVITPF